MANTGYKHYTTRVQVLLDPATGLPDEDNPTGIVEANVQDADYVPDELNYGSCPLGSPVYVPNVGTNSAANACADSGPVTGRRHDGDGVYPVDNDTIYIDDGWSDTLDGGGLYYKFDDGTSARISPVGLVYLKQDCI